MLEQDFINSKIKEGFTKQQATMMAKMSFAKQQYAQQGQELDYKKITSKLKDIDKIETGVYNTSMGKGMYLYTKDGGREYVTDDAYRNQMQNTNELRNYLNASGGLNKAVPNTDNKTYAPINMDKSREGYSKILPIDSIRSGVENTKMGKGYYFNYANGLRDFVTEEGYNASKNDNSVRKYLSTTGGIDKAVKGTENKIYRPSMQNGGNYNYQENNQEYAQLGIKVKEQEDIVATRRDSLNLQKNYILKEKQLEALGYRKQNEESGSYPEAHTLMFKNYQDVKRKEKNNTQTQIIQPQGYRMPGVYPSNIYREENVNDNPYLYKSQEAGDIGVLNPQVPYSFYDTRISPTKKDLWINDEYNDGVVNYGYDFGDKYAPKPRVNTGNTPVKNNSIRKSIKPNSVAFTRPIDKITNKPMAQGGNYYDKNNPYFMNNLGNQQETPEQIDFINNENYQENKNLNYGEYKPEEPLLGNVDPKVIEDQNNKTQQINNGRVNIINPFGGVGLEDALNYGFQGLGEGNGYKAGVGLGLSALKGARIGLSGYANGRENKRVAQEYNRNIYAQSGGKITNAEIMAQNAITDQGQGNINLEGGELVQNPQGQIQPVYGSRHVENGKIAKGVNANLEDGSRVLSDAKGLIMLSAKDAKELKDRYNISVKKGDTPAQAQKKFDSKIGLKKEQDILANYAEKMEKTLTIKDAKTKQVNLEFLQRSIAKTNTKIDTLSEMSKEVFEDLFNIQEGKPKKGDGTQLYNSKGKEVTEKKEGIMQQGGDYMSNLASQYGISKERAQQLLQMGGQAEQQEPQQSEGIEQQVMQALQEGAQPEEILQQLSQQMPPEQAQQILEQVMTNSQEGQPQQEGSQDIMGMVMEALQNGADPNQVVQGLIEQGVEEQEAVNIVSEMTQGEHQMQSGGQVYAQQAFFKPNKYAKKDYSNQPFIEGMTTVSGDMSDFNGIKERMAIQNQDLPYLVRDSKMYEDSNPNMANIGNFQEAYDNYVKSTLDEIELNKNLTDGEKKQYKEIATKQLLGLSKKSGDYDKVYGDETSTRTKLTLPYVSKKDKEKYGEKLNNLGDVLDDKGGIKEDFKDLDPETKKRILDTYKRQGNKALNIGLGEVSKTADKKAEEPSIGTPAENRARIQYNSTTQNVMPQLPMDLRLAPSAMQPLAKEYVPYGRIDPLKATPEQMLTEQERQRQTDAERVQQSGLSAGQQEAVLAQGLAASQMASNDAISKTQDWNNQNQFQVNTFNNQQRTKEAISNANFNQDFQNKTLGSIAATERDWRNYYLESNLQNRADYSSIENANLLKKNSDKYTYIPGQGVKFIGGQSQDIAIPNEYSKAEWQLMTMEERNKAMQKKIDSQKVSQMGGMKKSYFGY